MADSIIPVLTMIGATIVATATIVGGLGAFMWRRFGSVYEMIDHNRKNSDQKFLIMDDKMQERHVENLEAFEKIRLCLAKAGIWNGMGSIHRGRGDR